MFHDHIIFCLTTLLRYFIHCGLPFSCARKRHTRLIRRRRCLKFPRPEISLSRLLTMPPPINASRATRRYYGFPGRWRQFARVIWARRHIHYRPSRYYASLLVTGQRRRFFTPYAAIIVRRCIKQHAVAFASYITSSVLGPIFTSIWYVALLRFCF